ncbi:hypothetical protein LH462_11145 [Laribacter hongkongensis]|nr:hypothetical protein [Laribacter hongkongensis]MCG9104274.1 hypothetical protein [Laribacter hongkongensis]MCG9105629.1 hypothetical protein [Laribacter hongkongensis]MCG9113507.1 hypothetical protein [Laribacter hongkongensis]
MDMTTLHSAIETGLSAELPGVDVRSYPDLEGRVSLPLVLVELAELEDGTQPGTGELALVARLEARVVVDPNQRDAELLVRQLACRLAAACHFKTWGLPIGVARVQSIAPDGFKADLDGYLVWCVTWTHEVHVGDIEEFPMPDGATSIVVTVTPEPGAQESVDTGANHEL